jgi:hypothetical protein
MLREEELKLNHRIFSCDAENHGDIKCLLNSGLFVPFSS